MHSIFNHSVDCNIKQVLNNVHVCTSVVVNVPKPNSKAGLGFFFFSFYLFKFTQQGLFKNKKRTRLMQYIKKMFSVVETSVFMLLSSPRSVYTCGD